MNAIEKIGGPCIILAGAGTGKTRTIVEKVKYIIEDKAYDPEKIVCITFSNEAANNLLLRIEKIVENLNKKPIVRTFHGFSADLLKLYGEKIGISKDFKILDPDQAKVVLHRNFRVNAANCHKYIGTIGSAKDLGISIEDFQKYLNEKMRIFEKVDLEKRLEWLMFELQTLHLKNEWKKKKGLTNNIKKIKNLLEVKRFVGAWSAYEKLKKKGNYQDYSDLNKNALELLEKNPEIASEFSYVIVDEFQDTNKLQLDFLIKLARNRNITIVGDVNQSIYRFRGAYKENLNLFKQAFQVSERDIFTLAKSYRSPNKVLRTAHSLILNNYVNPCECFFVENVNSIEGEKIEVYEMKNSKEEARKIVEFVKRESDFGIPLEEVCVMFRTHQQGRIIRRALEQAGIPYVAVSKASLIKQKSIKTARDFLIILDKLKRKEKGGEQAWWDLVYQLEFPQEDLVKIGKAIKEFSKGNDKGGKGSSDEVNNEKEILSVYLFNNLPKLRLSDSGKMAASILIEKIKQMLEHSGKLISQLVTEVYRIAGLINEQKTKQEKEIMLNLNKFYEIIKVHEELYDSDLNNFLYYLDVLERLGIEIEASTLEEEGVRLMTSHSTKGLEFRVVIITNMAQGRFPIERYGSNHLIPTELLPEVKKEVSALSEQEIEDFIVNYEKYNQLLEERRLAYVSFTRAKEKLILTFAEQYGNKKFFPSQFLKEIKYKENLDVYFEIDGQEKYKEPEIEIRPAIDFYYLINSKDFEDSVNKIANSEQDKSAETYRKLSPSALLLFDDCQKQFEYKYVFNMPERKTISWEAMRLGSFVHLVLEKGVSSGFKTVEEFLHFAKELSMCEDWASIETGEAEMLIRVFFERNKGKYNEKSKTEQYLPLQLSGIDFMGFADRIDFGDKGAEIIDYKTGKSFISSRNRNWQLGFYALAAKEKYGNVRKVVLDMLKQEKPFEFEIDEKGNAVCLSSSYLDGFNIYEVKRELVETAKKIRGCYKTGFKPCAVEKNCEFCNEYVYG